MSTDVVIYDKAQRADLCKTLGINGSPQHIDLLFKIGEKYQLDVLTKEVTLIPNKGPFIGVWGRLHIAHRSGMLDGLEMDEEEETEDHYKVRCVVWRKDQSRPAAKVVGRVRKSERKDWPFEIARARAVRAGLGFAFSIHDAFDDQADNDDGAWQPPPDERLAADGSIRRSDEEVNHHTNTATATVESQGQTTFDVQTGEVLDAEPAPAPPPKPARSRKKADADPPTLQVGGHSPAQKFAIAARNAGIDDDQTRHDVIFAASNYKYTRGSDVSEDDPIADRIIEAFTGLADGTVEFRYQPDGTPALYRVKKPS